MTLKKASLFSSLLLVTSFPGWAQTPASPATAPARAPGPTQATPATTPAPGPTQATPATAPASSPTQETPAPAATANQPAGTATSPADANQATGKSAPVCFKLTGRCVEPSAAKHGGNGSRAAQTKGSQGSASAKPGSSSQKPLNLTAPDVRSVVPAEELKEPLPTNEQIVETQEDGTVSVKGEQAAPDVPGGFGALWWALNHPSQAWRIFAPAE